jgi:hypothetical protein
MYRVKLSILQEFLDIQDGRIETTKSELINMITGKNKSIEIMTIDGLIREFLKNGTTSNAAFSLDRKEIEQLTVIKDTIGAWVSEINFTHRLSEYVLYNENIDMLYGLHGGEVKIGMEFNGLNRYDDSIYWQACCLALQLEEFTLFHINYGDFRPYSFKLLQHKYYPNNGIFASFLLADCTNYILWCRANHLEKFITT